MALQSYGIRLAGGAASLVCGALAILVTLQVASFAAEDSAPGEQKPGPCTDDAMIVFDASGSMSGNQTLGIPNSKPRIDEVRWALSQVLPSATKFRRVGLITYGPGPYNQCNVQLDLKPTKNAAKKIMNAVNSLVPAGKTPLTSAVEQAAEVLDFRNKPGVIVAVTDGEETCGRSPCELAKALHDAAEHLTVHVVAFRYSGYSWTGESSLMDLMCLANQNNGLYIKANSEQELVEALEKTLDCPMISQLVPLP
jgi:Ca-activated chloride channel homolog